MTAVLQFEIDRKRLSGFRSVPVIGGSEDAFEYIVDLAMVALRDTFANRGTFVLVVSDEKITIVQRQEASAFSDKPRE